MYRVISKAIYTDGVLFRLYQVNTGGYSVISEPTLAYYTERGEVENASVVRKHNARPFVRLASGVPTKELHKAIPKLILDATPMELAKAKRWYAFTSGKTDERAGKKALTPRAYNCAVLTKGGLGEYIVKSFNEAYSSKRRKSIVITETGDVYVTFKADNGYDKNILGSIQSYEETEFMDDPKWLDKSIRNIKTWFAYPDGKLNSLILRERLKGMAFFVAYGDSHAPGTTYDHNDFAPLNDEAFAKGKGVRIGVYYGGVGLRNRDYNADDPADAPVLSVRAMFEGGSEIQMNTRFNAFIPMRKAEELAELIAEEYGKSSRTYDEYYQEGLLEDAVNSVEIMKAPCVSLARPLNGTW